MSNRAHFSSHLFFVERSKNATHFSDRGASFVAGAVSHPDRFALRPPHKEVSHITNIIIGGIQ